MTASPDFLDASAPDMKRVNKRPYALGVAFFVIAALLMATGVFQMIEGPFEERKAREEEQRVITKTATPPVKHEDIPRPIPAPVLNDSPPSGPVRHTMPESARQWMELEKSAREAPSAVQAFDRIHQQQTPPSQPPRDKERQSDPNMQDHKQEFLAATPTESRYSSHTRKEPIAPGMEITRGTVIPGVMLQSVNSDLPGQCRGQVSENVYDSATGENLLIPAGAKLLCTYDSMVSFGQNRLLIAWKEIEFPDGSFLLLDRMPGTGADGAAGMAGQVNNHYGRIAASVALLSLFSAASQLTQPRRAAGVYGGYDAQQILTAAMGREISMTGRMFLQRELSIQPTIEIPFGTKFNIAVSQAMVFDRVWQR